MKILYNKCRLADDFLCLYIVVCFYFVVVFTNSQLVSGHGGF